MAEDEIKKWLTARSHLKVAVIGDGGVGKSCIIQRFLQDTFSDDYSPTLEQVWETDVRLPIDATSTVNLHLSITDTAGQEDFSSLRDLAIANNDVFLVVFSLVELKTLNVADSLIEAIERCQADKPPLEPFPGEQTKPSDVPDLGRFVLAGNKCDMVKERTVQKADAERIASKHKGKMVETSAKSGVGVKELFQELGKLWFELNPRLAKAKHKSRGAASEPAKTEGGCCEIQ
jgi:GTPase SAR1 family protein